MKKLISKCINSLLSLYYFLMRQGSKFYYRYKVRKLYHKGKHVLSKAQEQEIKEYWYKFTKDFDIGYHRYYLSLTDAFDVRYIPDDLYVSRIDPYFNDRKLHAGVCDKNYFDIWFPNANMPKTLVRVINGILYDAQYKIITAEKAQEILIQTGKFIVKPALDSCGGVNVAIHEGDSKDDIALLLASPVSKNMIIQEVIRQHEKIAAIHPSSVNTLRLMTLLLDGKIYCIQSILRMGINGSMVDNAMAGGIYCGIDNTGHLKEKAYDLYGKEYTKHPQGFKFQGYKIPGYEAAVEMVIREAEKMAHFRMISWDVAIDFEEKPVLIEANLQMGDIDIVQPVNGPLFGDLTEQVLKEVYSK